MSSTPVYDRQFEDAPIYEALVAAWRRPVRVFWAPVSAFENPDAPTVEEIERMTEFSGTIEFYYEGPDRLGF